MQRQRRNLRIARPVRIHRDAFGSTISDQAIVVAKTVQSYGKDPAKFLADFRLDLTGQPNAYVRFPAALMADVWNRAAELCGDRHFAVRAAEQIDASFYYLLGPALRSSASIPDALRRFCTFAPVISDALAPMLTETTDTLWITFHEKRDRSSPVVQDVTLSYLMQVLRQIDDPHTRPIKITLSRKESEYSPELLQRLQCAVEFCAPSRTIQFVREQRRPSPEEPLSGYDRFLEQYLRMISTENTAHANFRVFLRAVLSECDLTTLAKRLSVSKRTLQRLLSSWGTSFLDELDVVRCEVGLQRLCEPRVSMTQLAIELGFCDSSHFCKAVKRWTGLSPRSYRRLMFDIGTAAKN